MVIFELNMYEEVKILRVRMWELQGMKIRIKRMKRMNERLASW